MGGWVWVAVGGGCAAIDRMGEGLELALSFVHVRMKARLSMCPKCLNDRTLRLRLLTLSVHMQ